ncbi:uncharacterized protein CC84DRAFT_1168742, partial [Paraphaeosphaeria sporulosa]
MGSIKRFVRRVTGRTPKNQNDSVAPSNVGVSRTVFIPSSCWIQSDATILPATAVISSHRASPPDMAPIPMLLPTLDPIQPVSPIQIPNAIRSTSPDPAPKFSLAEHVESDGDDSHPVEESQEEDSFRCQVISAPLPRDDTTATIFRPPTPPPAPRMTSASFARLPEYVDSSDSIAGSEVPPTQSNSWDGSEDVEVPRTGTGSFHSDVEDSEPSGMLSPLEFSAEQEDLFSSSSSPDRPIDRNRFALPGPPSYHGWPLVDGATPSRPQHRPSSVHMPGGPTLQRATHRGSTRRSRGSSSIRRLTTTPSPVGMPQKESSPLPAIRGPEHSALRTQPRTVYLPPPSSSSPLLQENPFFTRMEPLPSSTPMLPRSDDFGINLQDVLLNNVFFPDIQEHSSVEDGDEGNDETSFNENWEEHRHERTPSEQAECERAERENAVNFEQNGAQHAWWEGRSKHADPAPGRDPYDRSGARASFGFRRN